MSTQEELDAIMRDIADEYGKLNDKQQEFAEKEFARLIGEVAAVLALYSEKDGTIKRERLTKILRELTVIEESIRKTGLIAVETIIKDTAIFATEAIDGALHKTIGATVISDSAATKVNRDVARYVVSRFGDDGLILSDRVWNVSGDIRDELSKTLRAGIIRGESVNSLIKRVRDVHENETWKIKRLVVTEGNTAHRVATAYNAQRSNVVKGLRIIDRPGGHSHHGKHHCYDLAHQDPYGWGMGVYKPTDSQIYSPHPNCRAILTYVLK